MKSSVFYNGYVIEIFETKEDYKFIVKKDKKLIIESAIGFPFPSDAEIQGKMYVDRLIGEKNGWRVT